MKKFLFHVLICVAALLMINVVYLFTVGGNLRNYERKYINLRTDLNALVLGDSHPNQAWAANEDPQLYNFANGSDNPVDMSWKLDYVIAHSDPKIDKQLILSFDPQLISKYREKMHNNAMNALINQPWMDKRIPYLLPLFFDKNTELDTKRFLLGVRDDEAGADDGLIRKMTKKSIAARLDGQFPSEEASEQLMQTYQQLIDKARSHGYRIVAVQYPVHPYYDSLMQHNTNAIRLSHLMDSIAQANKLEIHRFSKQIPDKKYYMDQDHLNKNGSRVFMDLFRSQTQQ